MLMKRCSFNKTSFEWTFSYKQTEESVNISWANQAKQKKAHTPKHTGYLFIHSQRMLNAYVFRTKHYIRYSISKAQFIKAIPAVRLCEHIYLLSFVAYLFHTMPCNMFHVMATSTEMPSYKTKRTLNVH